MDCFKCRFSHGITEKQLVCRLNPPQVVVVPIRTLQGDAIAAQSIFPQVLKGDYCYQFQNFESEAA